MLRVSDGVKARSAPTPTARPTAARKPNMPIGMKRPTAMVMMLMTSTATRHPFDAAREVRVQPLPFATRRLPHGSTALIELASDALEAGDRPVLPCP